MREMSSKEGGGGEGEKKKHKECGGASICKHKRSLPGMDNAREQIESLMGNAREPSLREQIEEMTAEGGGCCSLTYEERIIGFAGCVISGMFLNMFSMVRLAELMLGNPKPFAVCFTLGNLLSMGSMLFLVGPKRQFKNLFSSTRRGLPTAVYILMMICTLWVAFAPGLSYFERLVLIIICLVLQILALAWYVLSYIPYGTAGLKHCARWFWPA